MAWIWLAVLGALAACGPSDDPGRTSAVTEKATAGLDTLVPALLHDHQAIGAAVVVLEDGAVAARSYGLADAARAIPFTDSTLVNVASVSKAVTAWGVLRAHQVGHLSLDEPVGDLLTGWVPNAASHAAGITVRRLLSHTAGLGLPSVPGFPADTPPPALSAVLAGSVPESDGVHVEQPPGSGWSYSGGGYTVLELLLEDRTGMRFSRYMRESVLEPLGLRETTFMLPPPSTLVARGHDEDGESTPRVRYVGTSAAGLHASARDFGRLLQGYHQAWVTGNPVLASETLQAVSHNPVAVSLDGVEGAWYGLGHGVHTTRDGRVLLYHSGGNPGYRAYFIVDPAGGNGLFIAVNSENGVPVIAQVREAWGAAHGGDLPPLY